MKYRLTIAIMLLAVSSASAQQQLMSSHAPSAPKIPGPKADIGPTSTESMQVSGKPVVRVNDAVLTDRDLLREMLALFPYAKLHGGFPKKQEAEIRRGALQMIVFEELVYQEALRRKMTIPPARLAREENKFKSQFNTPEQFDAFLKTDMDGSEAKLRQQIKRSLLIEVILKNEVESKSVVSLSDARAYYLKNSKQYEHGEVFAFQTISILPLQNSTAETLKASRQKAEDLLVLAKATKNYEQFGLLAEKSSEDDYRVNMGDHRTVVGTDVPPEVAKVARKMKVGEVSPLIQLGNAFTIIRLNGYVASGKSPFYEVKAKLTKQLQQQKQERLRAALDQKLHQNAKIQEL